jgi:hypothetical protein
MEDVDGCERVVCELIGVKCKLFEVLLVEDDCCGEWEDELGVPPGSGV